MHFSQPQPRKNGQAMAGDTLWALCLRSAEQHIYSGLWKQQHPSQHTPSATQHIDDQRQMRSLRLPPTHCSFAPEGSKENIFSLSPYKQTPLLSNPQPMSTMRICLCTHTHIPPASFHTRSMLTLCRTKKNILINPQRWNKDWLECCLLVVHNLTVVKSNYILWSTLLFIQGCTACPQDRKIFFTRQCRTWSIVLYLDGSSPYGSFTCHVCQMILDAQLELSIRVGDYTFPVKQLFVLYSSNALLMI